MKVIDKQLFGDTFQYFDKEIVAEIIDIFLNEYSDRLISIKESIDKVDFANLKFQAHSLKGVVANFSAPQVFEVAKTMEMRGTNEENIDLVKDFEELSRLTLLLADELKEMKQDYI